MWIHDFEMYSHIIWALQAIHQKKEAGKWKVDEGIFQDGSDKFIPKCMESRSHTMDQSPGENEKEMKRWRCPDMRQKAEGIHIGWPQILTWEGNQR